MSSYLSHLIYGATGSDRNDDPDDEADAQSLFRSSVKPTPQQTDATADEDPNQFIYGGLDSQEGYDENELNINANHLPSQFFQEAQTTPQHFLNLSQEALLSQKSKTPTSVNHKATCPQNSNLSQDSASPQEGSEQYYDDPSSYLDNLIQETKSETPNRNRAVSSASYQSQVYFGDNVSPERAATAAQLSQDSVYLSQMIYGDPDHYEDEDGDDDDGNTMGELNNGLKEANAKMPAAEGKKKRKREDDMPDDEELLQEGRVNEIATNMLNALYSGKGGNASVGETAAHRSFENPFLTSLRIGNPQDNALVDDQDLTEEEREAKSLAKELKRLKMQRHVEWTKFRGQWKTRTLDLREETDVGNAYLLRARGTLEPKLLLEMEQKEAEEEKKELEEDQQSEEKENKVVAMIDAKDSQEGHIFMLQSLSQSIEREDAEKAKKSDPVYLRKKKQLEEMQTAIKPYAASMDYWEQGKADPPPADLDFYYPRDIPDEIDSNTYISQRKRKWEELASKTTIVLKGESNQPEKDSTTLFQFPFHRRRQASGPFTHKRQIMRIAARCIVKATGEHDDRLLRALWQPGHEKAGQMNLLLSQTLEYGQNMATFLGHMWKNDRARKLVAKRLGISKENDFDPPPGLMRYTLEPKQVQALCNLERQKLVDRYSVGKMATGSDTASSAGGGKRRKVTIAGPSKIAAVVPTVGYIHLPGTVPPVPAFPLDEAEVLFGPTDRHVSFRHVGGIDEATYKLTFSSLVTRLAGLAGKAALLHGVDEGREETEPQSADQDLSGDMRRLQEQLFLLINKAPAAAKNDFFKRKQFMDPNAEIPLVQFYRAMMFFCSFAVSGCPQPKWLVTEPNDSDNAYNQLKAGLCDDDRDGTSVSKDVMNVSVLSMDKAAHKIVRFCEPLMKHNGLQAFPRLHLVFGIATIAEVLPASAASLLLAPLDGQKNRTPFDIFRRTLEHMEDESMFIEEDQVTKWDVDDDCVVRIVQLEYALHKAMEIFGFCIQRDPIDIKYHEWRLGALGASLLLCSGHKMGHRAVPFPSSNYMPKDSGPKTSQRKKSKYRKTLDKFEEVRKATIEAFKLLVQLTQQQQNSTRGNLAVSSFWEWRQVVALLAGRSCFNSRRLMDIANSHLYHTLQWASHERSDSALNYLEIMAIPEGDRSDIRLKQLAAAVEVDPNNVENWRALVTTLGPLGFDALHAAGHTSCEATICQECQLLRDGFAGDHILVEAKKSSGEWWGRELVEWWYPHYLTTTLQVPENCKTPQKMKKLENSVIVGLIESDVPLAFTSALPARRQSTSLCDNIEWLWCCGDDQDDNACQDDEQISHVDEALPKPREEAIDDQSETCSNDSESVANLSPEMEAVYLKLVVTCHLFGIAHPGVAEAIYELARRCLKGSDKKIDSSREEWRCLVELSSLGLDFVKVIKLFQRLTHREREKKKDKRAGKPRFSEAQREAVRDGLERFGHGKWVDMSQHYEPLAGLTRFAIRDIYKWIVEYEGMENELPEPP